MPFATEPNDFDDLTPEQLRTLTAKLIAQVREQDRELIYRQTRIDQSTHEISILKRHQFGKRSEQLDAAQASLLEETIDGDIAAIELELEALRSPAKDDATRKVAKRAPLPAQLPRVDIRHEPKDTICSCGCQLRRIGEDVSEKLDYTPGVFSVERHIRGKWVCSQCETLIQAPVPAQVIDKGIPTAGLLAQVLVGKFSDHLPLYRQTPIFARAGLAIAPSTLGAWVGVCGVRPQPLVDALRQDILEQAVLHADETPVQMLSPGKKKTHRAYLWAYTPPRFADLQALVYDFTAGAR
jgi:transposase